MPHTFFMKTLRLKSSLFVGLSVLLFMFPWIGGWKNSALKDIAKPYLGTYECRAAKLDEKDYLAQFSYIRLELKKKGAFTFYYKPTEGKEKREEGKYSFDKKQSALILQANSFPGMKRAFPLKDGVLYVTVPFGERTLHMELEQK